MERKDSQTSKGKKERNSRKASVRTGPKGEALVEISPALASLFRDFSDRSLEFSREVIERSGVAATTNTDHARLNIRIARTVFGKWSVEILTFLYSARVARFQELRKALGEISARVLSLKLARLEGLGFVHRAVIDTRPDRGFRTTSNIAVGRNPTGIAASPTRRPNSPPLDGEGLGVG